MRIYVGNLPFSTGEAELQELFSAHGEVTSAGVQRAARHHLTQQHKEKIAEQGMPRHAWGRP